MGTRANTVRLPEHTWDDLRKQADRRGVSMNALICEAVITYLAHIRAIEQESEAQTYERLLELVKGLM